MRVLAGSPGLPATGVCRVVPGIAAHCARVCPCVCPWQLTRRVERFASRQFHVVMPWLNISVWGVFHMVCFNGAAWLALANHLKGAARVTALPVLVLRVVVCVRMA